MKAYVTRAGIRFVGMMAFQTTKPKGTFDAILDALNATTLKSGKRALIESADQCVVDHNIPDIDAVRILNKNGIAANMAENEISVPATDTV